MADPERYIAQYPANFEGVYRELLRVQSAFDLIFDGHKEAQPEEPDKPVEGMVVFADGESWDPGDGKGLYLRKDDVWVKIHAFGTNEVRWEDLRSPATAINPPGQPSDPDWDISVGGWLFAPSGTEILNIIAQLPHGYNEGSSLSPHLHWQKTTNASGNVHWRMEYRWAPINAVMDTAWTQDDITSVAASTPDTDSAGKHLISAWGDITATGKSISDMLLFRISRMGSEPGDTYASDARLLEFDIHVQYDEVGSDTEFSK